MDVAEGLLSSAAKEILGTYEAEWMGEKIDLTPGWPRLTMIEAVKQYVGIDFGAISDDAQAVAAAKAKGVELADSAEKTWGNALYQCFDQRVEEHLIQPTFITMDYAKESLRLHGEWKGKIEVVATVPVATRDDLSLAYTPGVAQPCLEIQKDVGKSYDLTRRHNMCLVVTDGSAVLGLGDIGPEAGMPVMEGKCVLFKAFGNVDAFPLCIKSNDVDEIVNTIYLISGSFGGVNLEDIAAPRCFEIERKLKEKCDIPIFHDDQHGTAVITLAGLQNALKVVDKQLENVKITVNGAGAAAIAITKLLLSAGARDVTLCDRTGIVYKGREKGMTSTGIQPSNTFWSSNPWTGASSAVVKACQKASYSVSVMGQLA